MDTKNILIADDDRDLTRALAMRCQNLGVHVLLAHDALAALSLINQNSPDLVILDINMPAGNGLSVCEMMDSEPFWSSIPVIILTGQQDEKTIRRCHELCAYYVLKCADVWPRIEPLIQELLKITPVDQAFRNDGRQEPITPKSLSPDEIWGLVNSASQQEVSGTLFPSENQ